MGSGALKNAVQCASDCLIGQPGPRVTGDEARAETHFNRGADGNLARDELMGVKANKWIGGVAEH